MTPPNKVVTLTTANPDEDTFECSCGAKAKVNSREAKRFLKRHPALCSARKAFSKQLASTVRSVDADQFDFD